MIYNFHDLFNDSMYENSRLLVILGKYGIFNNRAAARMKQECHIVEMDLDQAFAGEFGVDDTTAVASTVVDIGTFMEVYTSPGINGKWFCREDYSTLTKNQRDWILRYGRSRSNNGILVITIDDFKDFRLFTNNKIFKNSITSNAIRLTYPNKKTLDEVVYNEFLERGFKVVSSAVDLFVYRMGEYYEDYSVVISNVTDFYLYKKYTEHDGDYPEIDYKEMADAIKHIEKFNIDGLLNQLVESKINNKVNRKKIYTMMYNLKVTYGPVGLVNQLKNKISEMVEYRTFINTGYIPVKFRYFYDVVVNSIGDLSVISKHPEWKFRRNAYMASQTSLRDWVYMLMILNSVNEMSSSEEYEAALYRLVIRKVLSENTLKCMVGIGNLFNSSIDRIDRIVYKDVHGGEIEQA